MACEIIRAAAIRGLLALLTAGLLPASPADDLKPDPTTIEFFEKQVRPLLVARCASCHGASQQFSSLRVDSREALLRGGNRGPAIVPGDAQLSLLAKAVRHEGLKMPVGGKLEPGEIAALEKWINLGAPWPEDTGTPAAKAGTPGLYERLKKEHWAFQPVAQPATGGVQRRHSPGRPFPLRGSEQGRTEALGAGRPADAYSQAYFCAHWTTAHPA